MKTEPLEVQIGRILIQRNWRLAVAESCTGGPLGHRITNVPGSSAYFIGGMLVYANEAKEGLLGVPADILETHGAVSQETVQAMALGVRQALKCEIGIGISGVAGPGGGTADKPVGLVWIGLSAREVDYARRFYFTGDRIAVKEASAEAALGLVLDYLEGGLDAAG